ncbi:MAG: hypothetical protein ABSC01_13540 [Verrucomicrobiota bacterium]
MNAKYKAQIKTRKKQKVSWESCTWEGARREQLRRWIELPLREKLKAVEEMGKVAGHFSRLRRREISAREI